MVSRVIILLMASMVSCSPEGDSEQKSVDLVTHRDEIFQCEYEDCDAELVVKDGQYSGKYMLYLCKLCTPSVVCCEECGTHVHRRNRKGHAFNPGSPHVVRIPDLVSKGARADVLKKWKESIKQLIGAERFARISDTLYKNSTCTACLQIAGVTASMNAYEILTYSTKLSVGPNLAVVGVELLWYGYNWAMNSIDDAEMARLTERAMSKWFVMFGATKLGGTAVVALTGASAGVGVVAGLIIAAIAGYGWRKLYDMMYPSEQQKKRSARIRAMEEALAFFHFTVEECKDPTVFNTKALRRKFRKYALECHPDTNKGSEQKWLELSTHYGILVAMIENKLYEDEKVMREITQRKEQK